jgi:uncharacterized protein YraI
LLRGGRFIAASAIESSFPRRFGLIVPRRFSEYPVFIDKPTGEDFHTMSDSHVLAHHDSRRRFPGMHRIVLVAAMVGLVFSGLVSLAEPVSAASYRTTANLNHREGPGTSFAVIRVIPSGTTVEVTGAAQFGFLPVTFGGSNGFASADFLTAGGGSSPAPGGGVEVGDTITGSATTTDRLNLRGGPGISHSVRLTMPSGASVEVMGSAQSGFLPVRYNGTKGWASADFLNTGGGSTPAPTPTPDPGSGATIDNKVTTAALNLRSGPGTTFPVVTVLPPGTQVDVTGAAQNGFLPVRWAGRSGFAHSDFLVDPGSTPDPGSGDASEQEIIAIIYAAADRWGQPRADMLRVARCESNLDPAVVNRSSGASGLFQFMPSTFAFTPNGERGENIFNAYSSADAAGWMWANGMRNHWACQ